MRISVTSYQKSSKDYVDCNLFITIRDKETTCIKPYQQDLDLPTAWLWMFFPWTTTLKSSRAQETGPLGFDLFSILCTNHSRKTWSSHEVG